MTRAIPFEGCLNFRDLGGYPVPGGRRVQWGRLYRSDSLHRMTAADVDRLVGELGVVTVVDLRTGRECERGGSVPVESHPEVAALHVPMVDELFAREDGERPRLDDFGLGYALMLGVAGDRVATVLTRLAQRQSLPAAFYCEAGKDRTGALAALVLGLLGVADDDIVADYVLSHAVAPAIVERADREWPEFATNWRQMPDDALGAEARVMQSMLRHLRDQHGSLEGFAHHVGVSDATLDTLRVNLLEDDRDDDGAGLDGP